VRELRLSAPDERTLKLVAKVSKGTYIRTLGEDIGEALGCGGHLTSLRRSASGHFDLSACVTLDALEAMAEDERVALLLPVDALLPEHTAVRLDAENAGRFLSGLRRRGSWQDNDHVAVFGEQPRALLGTAHIRGGELIPERLLSPPEISQILETTQ
jgi:tRNA pseudouridine55 synthase